MTASGSAVQVPRQVAISIVDPEGRPLTGVDIAFSLGGVPLGGIRSSAGRAGITVYDPQATVEVRATLDETVQTALLPPGRDGHAFVFPHGSIFKSFVAPEAHCPDGTSGQPCVDCLVGSIAVRICA